MKKVFFVISTLNSGGIENYLLRFLKHYDGKFEIYIICKSSCEGELKKSYMDLKNIRFYKGSLSYLNPIPFLLFIRYINSIEPNAICDFTGNFAGIPLFLAKLARVPTRIAFYRGSTNRFKEKLFNKLYNNIMKRLVEYSATSILSNSQAAFQYFFKDTYSEDNRFHVIYNGINSKEFLRNKENLRVSLNISSNKFVVAHVGRFDPSKNHTTIIRVIQKVLSIDDSFVFILCGKNVDKELVHFVENNNLYENVKLLGYTNEVIKILNTADCFYFPSITEGQPNALIEALIKGLPFVTSNIAPILEVIPFEFRSQTVDTNDIDQATHKLLEIKNSPALQTDLNISEWAIKKFDSDKLFTMFYNEISK